MDYVHCNITWVLEVAYQIHFIFYKNENMIKILHSSFEKQSLGFFSLKIYEWYANSSTRTIYTYQK